MLKRLAQAHPLQQCLAVQFDTGACCDLNTGVLILGSNVRKTLKQKKNDADLHLEFRSRYPKLGSIQNKDGQKTNKLPTTDVTVTRRWVSTLTDTPTLDRALACLFAHVLSVAHKQSVTPGSLSSFLRLERR